MKHEPAPLWTIALLTIALASPALAVDGVLEINQACAVNTGCFSGDAAGLPVTITAAGSYRLTGNLTVPDENTDGITVSANDVGIDLNNFAIIGPVTCTSGAPLTCSHASGMGSGIERTSSSVRGTSVKNGSITGMGNYGVYLGHQAEVTNLRVRWNRLDGVFVGTSSTVSGNKARSNGDTGISAGSGSTVSGNTAYDSGDEGIQVDTGSMVSGNAARINGGDGIQGSSGSTVSGNAAYDNGADGIQVHNGSTVSGNTVRGNTGYGLNFTGSDAAYSENVISNNTAGTINGSAVQLGQNACDGNTTCP
jgi:parallel beta-helix repeat protein